MATTRQFGSLSLPPTVFGSMTLDRGEAAARALLDAVASSGVDVIDTAPLYGFGAVESLLGGHAPSAARILGKVGLRWDGSHGRVLFRTDTHVVRCDSRPASIRRDLEESLTRLRRSTLPLVHIHHRDDETPLDESLSALLDAVREGLVGAIGVSNFSASDVEEAQRAVARLSGGTVQLAGIQDALSLVDQRLVASTFPVVRARRLGVLAYSPLGRGLLSGAMGPERALDRSDWRRELPEFAPSARRAVADAIAARVAPIAARRGASISAIAIAWVLSWPEVSSAILGARDAAQWRENVEAASIELEPGEHETLSSTFAALPLGPNVIDRAREKATRFTHRLFSRLKG